MDNKYQHTPKILQKILVKIFKEFNLYQDLCPIDWSSPIRFSVEDNTKTDLNQSANCINIVYTDGYLVFLWDFFYKNHVSKNWHFLNELNNPLYQPSILLYTDIVEHRLVLWSKENYQGLTYELTYEWLKKFIQVLMHLKQHIIDNKELDIFTPKDKLYNIYNNML